MKNSFKLPSNTKTSAKHKFAFIPKPVFYSDKSREVKKPELQQTADKRREKDAKPNPAHHLQNVLHDSK